MTEKWVKPETVSTENFTAAQTPSHVYGSQENDPNTSITQCELCKTKAEVITKCLDCDKDICQICTSAHLNIPLTKDHKLQTIGLRKDGPKAIHHQCKIFCEFHSRKKARFFCITDDCLVCTDCLLVGQHKGHDCVRLEDIVDQQTNLLKKAYADIENFENEELYSDIKVVQKKRIYNKKLCSIVAETVSEKTDELVNAIISYRNLCLRKNEEICNKNDRKYEEIEVRLQKKALELAKIHERKGTLLELASPAEMVQERKKIDVFIADSQLARAACNQLDIQVSHFIANKTDKRKSFEDQIGFVSSASLVQNLVHTFSSKFTKIKSLCPEKASPESAWFIHQNERSLSSIDRKGNIQKTLMSDVALTYMIMIPDGNLLVTSFEGKSISKIETETRRISKVANTSPLHPRGLCMTTNGDVLVCVVDTNSYNITPQSSRYLIKMTYEGNIIKTIDHDLNNAHLFTLPIRVSENPLTKDICVLDGIDTFRGQLCILDMEGNLKTVYRGRSADFDPCDIVCDKRGQMIIADYKNHKIDLLDSGGNFLSHLFTDNKDKEKPVALSIDNDGCLWIGTFSGRVFILKYLEFDTN